MLFDIIKRLSEDTGIHLTQDRDALVNLVHRGAEPLYRRLECNAIMKEVTVLVPEDYIISLPTFVGPLRGMKESATDVNFPLAPMSQPKYSKNDWQYKWKNWRQLPDSAIYRNLNSVAPFAFEVAGVEGTGVTLKISGQTPSSNKYQETLVMDATSKSTITSFGPRVDSICCFDQRAYDITVKDDDGVVVAILYNNETETRYRIFDISQYSWSKDVSDGTTTVDVLYKNPYYKMVDDADKFPAEGYEDAIYFSCMALWTANQQGKEQLASTYYQQSLIEPKASKDDEEGHQVKKMDFGRNPIYGRIRRMSWGYPYLNSNREY